MKTKDKKEILNKKALIIIIGVLIVTLIITLILSRVKIYKVSVLIDDNLSKLHDISTTGLATVGFSKSSMAIRTDFSLESERQDNFYYEIRIGKDSDSIRGGSMIDIWSEKNFYNGAIIKKLIKNKDDAYFCYIENYNKENQVDHCFKIMIEEVK